MAKSFKQATAAKTEQPKRTSEKDIFDFLEEDRKPVPSAKDNTDNTSNTERKGTAAEPVTTGSARVDEASNDEERDVRQTFVIGQGYLERLKDYVHTKRAQGQYEYTQKQALHDALELLFQGAAIEPRPEHIRKQEDARKQKIRRGIPK